MKIQNWEDLRAKLNTVIESSNGQFVPPISRQLNSVRFTTAQDEYLKGRASFSFRLFENSAKAVRHSFSDALGKFSMMISMRRAYDTQTMQEISLTTLTAFDNICQNIEVILQENQGDRKSLKFKNEFLEKAEGMSAQQALHVARNEFIPAMKVFFQKEFSMSDGDLEDRVAQIRKTTSENPKSDIFQGVEAFTLIDRKAWREAGFEFDASHVFSPENE